MNDSLEQEESKNHLLEISKRISAPTPTVNEISLLKKGRILYEEDDITGVCSDDVFYISIHVINSLNQDLIEFFFVMILFYSASWFSSSLYSCY